MKAPEGILGGKKSEKSNKPSTKDRGDIMTGACQGSSEGQNTREETKKRSKNIVRRGVESAEMVVFHGEVGVGKQIVEKGKKQKGEQVSPVGMSPF